MLYFPAAGGHTNLTGKPKTCAGEHTNLTGKPKTCAGEYEYIAGKLKNYYREMLNTCWGELYQDFLIFINCQTTFEHNYNLYKLQY
ncbi:hypothetical protein [Aquimarina sp. AU119]|uniref:hypothetical protein n=1 Tax=Aquimarina sp. AU119 TaxID=2108528 RepID=UPI000D68612C|nr:hypothetical protein [Aquimarina sp. AU119]